MTSADNDTAFDVLGYGCVAVDDLLYVASYPSADRKVRVVARERQCGGLTATALVTAARLGARCAYAGILGTDDELSRFAVEELQGAGVSLEHAIRRPRCRPIHSVIIVAEDRRTRTIFYDLEGVGVLDEAAIDDALAASTKVLFVDHYGVEGMVRAANVARSRGIPVVADFESDRPPRFAELLALVDHLIVSEALANEWSGPAEPGAAVRELVSQREVAVVTCGERGCWYAAGSAVRHQPAFGVDVEDTTGCGDVFHGAYAFALARGRPLEDRIRLATAAAAIKATRRGGQAGIPDLAAVEAFLERRPEQGSP